MSARRKVCSNDANHTPFPSPMGFADWAENMGRTHEQTQCPECGLWAIWVPKRAEDGAA